LITHTYYFLGCDNIFVFQIKLITIINDATISTYTFIAFHAGLQYLAQISPFITDFILLSIKN